MGSNTNYELDLIKNELNSIIRELNDISTNVRYGFKGIGSEKCADCISSVVNQYNYAQRKLSNVNTTAVTAEFAKAHNKNK